MPKSTGSPVKSADRVFDLFELLAPREDGLTHQAIAEALDIPKSSLSQLLKTAIARGYIRYDADDKHYCLGDRLAAMQRPSLLQDLVQQAGPLLEEVTTATRESSALNVLQGDTAKVVATVSSPQRLVSHMRLGDLAPLYATSGGKAILAHFTTSEFHAYASRVNFEAITGKTISTVEELARQIDTIKREGFAYSFEEYTPGIIGMGVAILSETGKPLASVNVA